MKKLFGPFLALVELAGVSSVVYGVSLWSIPAAFVIGGLVCILAATLASINIKKAEAQQ
jgi:hypothetical protein